MINDISITGRIANDIKLRKTKDEKPFLFLTIAVNKGKDKVNFIPCIAWNKTSELINEHLKKGSLIGIEGELESYKKDDKYKVQVLIQKISFLETKKESKNEETSYDIDKIKF